MKKIAIFASGTGSNAERIMQHFKLHETINVVLVISNAKNALVLEKAATHKVETLIIDRSGFYKSTKIVSILKERNISLIVLAGFLWLIPEYLIEAFPNKIINIHPALLPKYGGKGMYGMNVHRAVYNAKEQKSGITIHYVNKDYDEGKLIFQTTCSIDQIDTPEAISSKVLKLEHLYFASVIEKLLLAK